MTKNGKRKASESTENGPSNKLPGASTDPGMSDIQRKAAHAQADYHGLRALSNKQRTLLSSTSTASSSPVSVSPSSSSSSVSSPSSSSSPSWQATDQDEEEEEEDKGDDEPAIQEANGGSAVSSTSSSTSKINNGASPIPSAATAIPSSAPIGPATSPLKVSTSTVITPTSSPMGIVPLDSYRKSDGSIIKGPIPKGCIRREDGTLAPAHGTLLKPPAATTGSILATSSSSIPSSSSTQGNGISTTLVVDKQLDTTIPKKPMVMNAQLLQGNSPSSIHADDSNELEQEEKKDEDEADDDHPDVNFEQLLKGVLDAEEIRLAHRHEPESKDAKLIKEALWEIATKNWVPRNIDFNFYPPIGDKTGSQAAHHEWLEALRQEAIAMDIRVLKSPRLAQFASLIQIKEYEEDIEPNCVEAAFFYLAGKPYNSFGLTINQCKSLTQAMTPMLTRLLSVYVAETIVADDYGVMPLSFQFREIVAQSNLQFLVTWYDSVSYAYMTAQSEVKQLKEDNDSLKKEKAVWQQEQAIWIQKEKKWVEEREKLHTDVTMWQSAYIHKPEASSSSPLAEAALSQSLSDHKTRIAVLESQLEAAKKEHERTNALLVTLQKNNASLTQQAATDKSFIEMVKTNVRSSSSSNTEILQDMIDLIKSLEGNSYIPSNNNNNLNMNMHTVAPLQASGNRSAIPERSSTRQGLYSPISGSTLQSPLSVSPGPARAAPQDLTLALNTSSTESTTAVDKVLKQVKQRMKEFFRINMSDERQRAYFMEFETTCNTYNLDNDARARCWRNICDPTHEPTSIGLFSHPEASKDWITFRTFMMNRLQAMTPMTAMFKLQQLRQKQRLLEYTDEFATLLHHCGSNPPPPFQIKQYFITGLKSQEMKRKLVEFCQDYYDLHLTSPPFSALRDCAMKQEEIERERDMMTDDKPIISTTNTINAVTNTRHRNFQPMHNNTGRSSNSSSSRSSSSSTQEKASTQERPTRDDFASIINKLPNQKPDLVTSSYQYGMVHSKSVLLLHDNPRKPFLQFHDRPYARLRPVSTTTECSRCGTVGDHDSDQCRYYCVDNNEFYNYLGSERKSYTNNSNSSSSSSSFSGSYGGQKNDHNRYATNQFKKHRRN